MIIDDPQHAVKQRNRLREWYRRKAYCDLHLRTPDGTLFRTHKVVLATYSNYFMKHAVRNKRKRQSTAEVINLDMDSGILSLLLDYIYRGKIEIQPETREGVQQAAETLGLQDIVQILEQNAAQLDLDRINLEKNPPPEKKKKTPSPGNKKKKAAVEGDDEVLKKSKTPDGMKPEKRKSGGGGEPRSLGKDGGEAENGSRKKKRKSETGIPEREGRVIHKGDWKKKRLFGPKCAYVNLSKDRIETNLSSGQHHDGQTGYVGEKNREGHGEGDEKSQDSENRDDHGEDDRAGAQRPGHHDHGASDTDSEVIGGLETKFMPMEHKSEFMGFVQSIIDASQQTMATTPGYGSSYTNVKQRSYGAGSSGNRRMACRNRDNDSDDNDEGPEDLSMPSKRFAKSYRLKVSLKPPQQIAPRPLPKRKPSVKVQNIKNLRVMKNVKFKGRRAYYALSKQIIKKYCFFTASKYAFATAAESQNVNVRAASLGSMPKKVHVCKVCRRAFTLESVCRSHILKNHQGIKTKLQRRILKSKKTVATRSRKSKSRVSTMTSKSAPSPRKPRARYIKKNRHGTFQENHTCTECGIARASRKSLHLHLMNYHKLGSEEALNHQSMMAHCEVFGCDFFAKTTKEVEAHVKTYHPEVEHKCPLCNYTFYLPSVLDKHMHLRHFDPAKMKHSCSFCGKKFNKLRLKKIHEQAKHGVEHGLNKFKCKEEGCGFTTANVTTLKTHATVHMGKNFQCPYCSMKIKTDKNLQRHINKIHLGIRPFLCQMCGMSFGDVHNLRAHIGNKHTVDKEFKCPCCPYMTSSKAQHSMHVYLIHGIKIDNRKEYCCPYCPYKALMKSRLAIHVNKHTNTRNYACDECGKTFVNGDTLRAHKEWLHSTAKYSCTYCHYVTKTDKRLQEHISIMHKFKGMKPYGCPYCPFTCATGGNTRKHVMKRHPGFEVKFVKNMEMLNFMKEVKKRDASERSTERLGNLPQTAYDPAPERGNEGQLNERLNERLSERIDPVPQTAYNPGPERAGERLNERLDERLNDRLGNLPPTAYEPPPPMMNERLNERLNDRLNERLGHLPQTAYDPAPERMTDRLVSLPRNTYNH